MTNEKTIAGRGIQNIVITTSEFKTLITKDKIEKKDLRDNFGLVSLHNVDNEKFEELVRRQVKNAYEIANAYAKLGESYSLRIEYNVAEHFKGN